MSNYENKGILFKNDYKEKESHPDYKGKINIDGQEKELAAWVREGKKGKFLSLSVSEPYDKKDEPQNESSDYPDAETDWKDDNGNLPF